MIAEQKRRLFEEHLKQQERQRQLLLQKKKYTQEHKNNPKQDMLFIQKEFRRLNQEIQAMTISLKKGETVLAQLFAHYNKMKTYYLEVNYVLTTYDRQYYKELLQKIHANLLQQKIKLEPKKKFKFSRRDEDFGVKQILRASQINAVQSKLTQISGLQGKSGEKITITTQCPPSGSFKIIKCQNSQIIVLQKTEILFLKNLKNCKIRAAVTKSTVFVDHCQNCQFQLNCHQLRIHNTFKSRFNIYVTSKAIIEDCNQVVFSPYTFQYPDKSKHEAQQQRREKPNLWKDIQDFNWLKENQKSPHFQLVQ